MQPRYGSHPLTAFGSLDAYCGPRWFRRLDRKSADMSISVLPTRCGQAHPSRSLSCPVHAPRKTGPTTLKPTAARPVILLYRLCPGIRHPALFQSRPESPQSSLSTDALGHFRSFFILCFSCSNCFMIFSNSSWLKAFSALLKSLLSSSLIWCSTSSLNTLILAPH